MKKIEAILCTDDTWSEYDEHGVRTDDIPANDVLKQVIDLVNSQQEAIEKLEKRLGDVDSFDGSFNLWGRDIDKRLRKVEAESKAMGEALVTHYNRPDAHKPIPEEPLEPADDKPEYKLPGTEEVIEKLDKATLRPNLVDSIPSDTHRTVTLRIPKGMRVGEAIRQVWMEAANSGYLGSVSDTDLQKALDEVQPNE